ncbi:SPOR domain-containing protein [Mucilaginibacter hurinus]|uniref:SPOR domain-containing protein n=1 Tax=Mucilaginibacter hurinus TaxID=2201324 RepID=A0A367GQ14_9SPHI|nr:SPOR domain-containing protein [Mucilaginibacter hurinus]RCH54793.1 SPOR domain-containing protein [Mucilaginibacter hurinus]
MRKAVSTYKAISKVTGCCIFFIFCSVLANAQTRGKVEVIKDARFDTLINRWSDLNKGKVRSSNWGYRVQIFSGSSRKDAFNAQARFQQEYPEMRTYISYRDPNFKVHAGDFRSRLEARKLMEDLKPFFSGMFIISGKINPPKLQATND